MKNRRRILTWLPGIALLLAGCSSGSNASDQGTKTVDKYQELRERMVETQIARRGIADSAVLAALNAVERHRFVPDRHLGYAYADEPLPIGEGQTISQPYIVAYMTQALGLEKSDRVLEIGTGSGYQAAVLAEIVDSVFTIEIIESLAERAESTLAALGYTNVFVRSGDGYRGWPEHAPYDGIIVTAAPDHVPQPLVDQLAPGGRMVIPIGIESQEILIIERTPEGVVTDTTLPVRFVPMTGEAQQK